MRWVSSLAFTSLSWNVLLLNEFDGNVKTYVCDPEVSKYAVCANGTRITSDMALATFEVSGGLFENFAYLFLYLFVVMLITYAAIRVNIRTRSTSS